LKEGSQVSEEEDAYVWYSQRLLRVLENGPGSVKESVLRIVWFGVARVSCEAQFLIPSKRPFPIYSRVARKNLLEECERGSVNIAKAGSSKLNLEWRSIDEQGAGERIVGERICAGRVFFVQHGSSQRSGMLVFAAIALLVASTFVLAQSTVGTGSVVGVVSDPSGVAVAAAKVTMTNKSTGAMVLVTTSSAGLYTSGPTQAGEYVVRIEAKGFNLKEFSLVVQVGHTVNGDVRLQLGTEKPIVELERGAVTPNIEQAMLQGLLTGEQVEDLPINGRNFMDLGQLEPGVQVQDGGTFDASKDGISGISFEGRLGNSARTVVDGVDVNDEIVGGSTQNIPASAIQEFQLVRSLPDLSTGLTSSGALNIATLSGSNHIYGEVFGLFRGDQGGASLPGSEDSFQREQFGGRAGGAIVTDKIFWFADAERVKQDLTAAEPFAYPFDGLHATLSQPYRDFDTDERLDWNIKDNLRAFFRLNYFENRSLRPYSAASSTQALRETNNTETYALGIDFHRGVYAHSLRFEYLKLRDAIADATANLSGAENPIPGLGINIGAPTAGNCVLSNGGNYCGGPSWLSPQQTIQSNKEAKYDGSRIIRNHLIRYGATLDRIDGGRLAAYSTFPQVGTTSDETSADPTSYPAGWVSLGNGNGFSTAKSAFNFPGGGLGPDSRVELYVGDVWKAKPHLTLTYGVRYLHDTGRTNSDLGRSPDLNQWLPGLGNQIRNPAMNFAPQFGFAWDASGNGNTVIRGGGGLYYENPVWNNVLFDSPARLSKGNFADAPMVCQGGIADTFVWPTSVAAGTSIAGGAATVVNTPAGPQAKPTFCGQTISSVAPEILALSSAFQSATAGVLSGQPNPNFAGTSLTALSPNYALFNPDYRTPRSWQMNLGFQQEIRPGTVLSVDYVRNIGERYLLAQDINHSGAASSFDEANALAARDAAQAAHGCATGLNQVTCMIAALGQAGAQAAYSAAGLDSNVQAVGGGPCPYCAFPGTNPISGNRGAVGGLDVLFSDGRSVYSGVQMKLVQKINKPVRGVSGANFQVSYSISRFISQEQDGDFINRATNSDKPLQYTGPNALDRRHQITFGGTFDLPFSTKLNLVGHFYSPPAQTLELPQLTNGGEIFASDWLGTGLSAAAPPEPVTGTQVGQFERATNITNLYNVITNYNHNYAGGLTPAGQCLAGNTSLCPGLVDGPQVLTQADLSALGWVMPTLDKVANQAVGIPWLKSTDLKVSRPFRIKDRFTVEPSASVFNVFNFWNAFLPGNLAGASLLPGSNGILAPNVVGGVTPGSSLTPFRASFQSGTFALGAPRQFEFGLRISF
jgi:hypothetical protein